MRKVEGILSAGNYVFEKAGDLLEMGEVETVRNGYFSRPKNNYVLNKNFGVNGTPNLLQKVVAILSADNYVFVKTGYSLNIDKTEISGLTTHTEIPRPPENNT